MRIEVRVIPRSRKKQVEWEEAGTLKVHVTAAPVDGAANTAVIAVLAEQLALPKRNISIVRGATSRHKILELTGITEEEIQKKLTEGKVVK